MAGIWTSAITHDVSSRRAECKNSSADANAWTVYPSDLMRLLVATRTDASSSIIEITGMCGKCSVLCRGTEPIVTFRYDNAPRSSIGKSYLGLHQLRLRSTDSEDFRSEA